MDRDGVACAASVKDAARSRATVVGGTLGRWQLLVVYALLLSESLWPASLGSLAQLGSARHSSQIF